LKSWQKLLQQTKDRLLMQRATESFDRNKDLLFHYSLSISDIGMMFTGTLDLQNSAFTGSLEDLLWTTSRFILKRSGRLKDLPR
jgi:hypothetical protein